MMNKVCNYCNKDFVCYKNNRKYCCRRCSANSQSKVIITDEKQLIKICPSCNQEFKVRRGSEISIRKYCSSKCQINEQRVAKIEKCCEICLKLFEVPPCLNGAKFCSRKCKGIGHRIIKDPLLRRCIDCYVVKDISNFSGKVDHCYKECRNIRARIRTRTVSGRFIFSKSFAKKEICAGK